jgi:hypothetical protein
MLCKKYKKLKTITVPLNLSKIIKDNNFIGFFQPKYLNLDNLIQIKQMNSKLNLNFLFCKNSYIKRDSSIPAQLSSYMVQGNFILLYSHLQPNNLEIMNSLINKVKLLPLFFYIFDKFVFLQQSYLLLKNPIDKLFIYLTVLINYYNKSFISLLTNSNQCIYNVLKFL